MPQLDRDAIIQVINEEIQHEKESFVSLAQEYFEDFTPSPNFSYYFEDLHFNFDDFDQSEAMKARFESISSIIETLETVKRYIKRLHYVEDQVTPEKPPQGHEGFSYKEAVTIRDEFFKVYDTHVKPHFEQHEG